jgi:protein-disulfide isomerase
MIRDPSPPARPSATSVQPLDPAIDHLRGSATGRLILEYGDYECPYSRRAFREIERVENECGDGMRFAFRHFPLRDIHPHAQAAAAAAEAAGRQGRFWEMHDVLFHHQKALEDDDLRQYAATLALDLEQFDVARISAEVGLRVMRDVESGIASGEVRGTPTLFIDGVVYRGSHDMAALIEALAQIDGTGSA